MRTFKEHWDEKKASKLRMARFQWGSFFIVIRLKMRLRNAFGACTTEQRDLVRIKYSLSFDGAMMTPWYMHSLGKEIIYPFIREMLERNGQKNKCLNMIETIRTVQHRWKGSLFK